AAKDREICLDSYYIVEKDNVLRESLKKTWHKGYPKIKLKVEDSLEAIEGQFDIIILSNVLEHLYRPKDMLEKAVEKLAEGGYIFADLPNQDYLFKLDVFPHLTFFNKLSLQMLFEKSGLSLQQIACYGRDMQGSPAGRGKNRVIFKILENLFYKLRFFIPVCISKRFYQWYYGTVTNNPQGTWIRALGKRSRGVNESSNHY
ncbi:MAG: class I SAM-dependent methyltransferase, partial [Candidatus Omnitrophica bacterium]|nr:class I SAM-dependent methyltransferase [Candidatus Omnitrophota bacterium]